MLRSYFGVYQYKNRAICIYKHIPTYNNALQKQMYAVIIFFTLSSSEIDVLR